MRGLCCVGAAVSAAAAAAVPLWLWRRRRPSVRVCVCAAGRSRGICYGVWGGDPLDRHADGPSKGRTPELSTSAS
eukprot:scaffold5717_cov112-Isochrysis_galbana.AAC.4